MKNVLIVLGIIAVFAFWVMSKYNGLVPFR
jgi:hypothetical protein